MEEHAIKSDSTTVIILLKVFRILSERSRSYLFGAINSTGIKFSDLCKERIVLERISKGISFDSDDVAS